jgi:hypothetical protein
MYIYLNITIHQVCLVADDGVSVKLGVMRQVQYARLYYYLIAYLIHNKDKNFDQQNVMVYHKMNKTYYQQSDSFPRGNINQKLSVYNT